MGGEEPIKMQLLQMIPTTTFPSLPNSLEEDFITWREQFWPAVCEHFGVEATGDESR